MMTNWHGNEPFFVTLNLFQGPFHPSLRAMRQERQPCAYILASQPYGTLYIGVTSSLIARLWQHRNAMEYAIAREKRLKNWRRQWKINLIEAQNP